jgi:hypothetical protein
LDSRGGPAIGVGAGMADQLRFSVIGTSGSGKPERCLPVLIFSSAVRWLILN